MIELLKEPVVIFTIGIFLGMYVHSKLLKFADKFKRAERALNINKEFKQILQNIKSDTSRFKSRFNSTVYIETNLEKYGQVDIVYLMDKKDIAIFKEHQCILTTESVEKETIQQITTEIENKFQHKINDIVNIMGTIFSREDFEKAFKINIEDLNATLLKSKINTNDIEEIISDNNVKHDIDEILDKISKSGIDSLTTSEKKYLDQFSNGKGN